jgi:hypothetical protein
MCRCRGPERAAVCGRVTQPQPCCVGAAAPLAPPLHPAVGRPGVLGTHLGATTTKRPLPCSPASRRQARPWLLHAQAGVTPRPCVAPADGCTAHGGAGHPPGRGGRGALAGHWRCRLPPLLLRGGRQPASRARHGCVGVQRSRCHGGTPPPAGRGGMQQRGRPCRDPMRAGNATALGDPPPPPTHLFPRPCTHHVDASGTPPHAPPPPPFCRGSLSSDGPCIVPPAR